MLAVMIISFETDIFIHPRKGSINEALVVLKLRFVHTVLLDYSDGRPQRRTFISDDLIWVMFRDLFLSYCMHV